MNINNMFAGNEMAESIRRNYNILESESDRGAVLVASSVIEKGLADLISSFLLESENKKDELFTSSNAPLATLEAKIAIAFRLGLIREAVRNYLNIFRRIRNDFAHNIETYSFDNQSVVNRLNEIYSIRKQESDALDEIFTAMGRVATARDKFLLFFSMDMAAIQRASQAVERIKPLD
ncbi:TPA: MltR family transcriptional regulator [Klebsiella oxytoca]